MEHYYWSTLKKDVRHFVRFCDTCQCTKASRQRPAGLLQSLPVPQQPWEQLTMDLITGLPLSPAGNNAVLVFTDKLSRMIHLIPSVETCTAQDVAELFLQEVFRLHGLPTSIISDRDGRFTSRFWQEVQKGLHTKLCLSSAYHPQTDDSTERVNQVVEDILRAHVSTHQTAWQQYLWTTEFAYNSADHSATQLSPFQFVTGLMPRTLLTAAVPYVDTVPAATNFLVRTHGWKRSTLLGVVL